MEVGIHYSILNAMSSQIYKYKIRYDGNDGHSYDEYLYCKYESVWNGECWYRENGTPVDFSCVTDNQAYVTACCIAGIPIENNYYYWKEIKEFELPEVIAKQFNYRFPQHIKNA
jgi:hypothetical protein